MVAVAALGLASCQSAFNVKSMEGRWNVVELNGDAVTPNSEEGPYMELSFEEGRLSGRGGCNLTNGMMELDEKNGASIKFPQVMTTMMACPEPQMKLEDAYLKALNSVAGVTPAKEGRFNFVDATGNTLFVVVKAAQ